MLPINALLQNRYQILRLIGRGGMGAVYEATDQRLGHNVAIKQIIHGEARAFEREARLLARLRHPALPSVSDYFVEEVGHFLVMDLVPGDDLAAILLRRQQPFTLIEVTSWASQLLDALTYLHSQEPPILHRDIKPANLKLMANDSLKLLDFGLAKGKVGTTSEPQKSAAGYTLCYAAPEQIRGEGTDVRSDLYAVAATLYHLLTGLQPPDALQRALRLAAGHPDPLWLTFPQTSALPPSLLLVLQKAMALDPAERFTSAQALHQALQMAITGQTVVAAQQQEPTPSRLSSHLTSPHNLPTQLTSLVGREQELGQIQSLFQRADVRLVTLTGAGGSGKTRLGLAVAQMLVDTADSQFADGIFLVNLASIRDPDLLISTIAQTVGVKEAAGQPLQTTLQECLRPKQMLLFLDNFEQIIAAAPQASELLAACPTLKMLVTSREVLRLRGEHEFLVPLLAVPTLSPTLAAAEAAHFAAIQLFVQRAQAVQPSFVLDDANARSVAEICVRLDGLPLAIELAAARVKVLTPPAILARLSDRFALLSGGARDLPDRQRTLRATIDWSYALLTADEQMLFRRLAVFVGGWTLEAAEQVCNPVNDEFVPQLGIEVLDGLASLMDKSLLGQESRIDGDTRFTMLVSIHEYAQEKLSDTGEMAHLKGQHALYFRTLVEKAESELTGSQQGLWLNRLEQEHDNIRTVLNWVAEHNEAELGARIGGSLWRFWERHGHLVEGRGQLEKILFISHNIPAQWRAKVLHATGNLTRNQGDYKQARVYYREALMLRRELKEKRDIVASLHGLGNVAYDLGDYDEAVPILEEALALWQELGNDWGVALEHLVLGEIAWCQANYQRAMALLNDGLVLYEKQKDTWGIAMSHINLGQVFRDQGNYEKATIAFNKGLNLLREIGHKRGIGLAFTHLASVEILLEHYTEAKLLLHEGLTLFQEQGEKWGMGHIFNYLGQICTYQGECETAKLHYVESVKLYRMTGDKRATAMALNNQSTLSLRQNNYLGAASQAQEGLALSNQVGNKLGIALALQTLAQIAALQAKFTCAISLGGAAEALRESIEAPLSVQEQGEAEQTMKLIHACLDEQNIAILWEQGRSMNLSEAVSRAMNLQN